MIRRLATKATGIPVVDFAPFLQGTGMESVSSQMVHAFKNVGFVYIKNHGIPQNVVDFQFAQSKAFFDLPQEEKDKLAWVSPEANRGYVQQGRERVSLFEEKDQVEALREAAPDVKESFEIGKEPSPLYQNNWPASMPQFARHQMDFFERCHQLHLSVLNSIGLGLGLPHHFFQRYCDAKDHNLRLLHYPEVKKSQNLNRAGAHTDYGSITLLFQDDKGGLQVQDSTGEYVPAPPIPGTIVINAGDLLARWSNDIIRSTKHRVVAPPFNPTNGVYPARYSIAFFCNPNWDARIACLDGCWSDSQPKKYEPVVTHDYLVSRLSATY
jgi:isopenicillin N synthase-like dioxygenase